MDKNLKKNVYPKFRYMMSLGRKGHQLVKNVELNFKK